MSDLPAGWEQKKIGDVFEFTYGKSLPDRVRSGKGFPVYGSNGIVGHHEKPLTQGETIIIGRKGSVGEVHYSSTPCFPIDTTYYIEQFHDMPARFWYYLLKFSNLGSLNKSTAIPGLNRNDAYDIDIPFPPLDEQKRIAEKLDSLLARVDSCQSHLERVPQILKRFRQSVLAAATSGRLTEDWREKNRRSGKTISFDFMDANCFGDYEFPDTWKPQRLKDIADVIGGITKDSKKQNVEDEELPYLRVANVQRGYLDLTEMKTIRVPKQRLESWLLKSGDILFNEGGDIDKLGRGWVWSGEIERCIFQNHVFRARLKDSTFVPKYFSHYGNSRGYDYFLAYGKQTTNLASINKTIIEALPVAVPPPDEQAEIVRRVEKLFACAAKLEARYTSASEHVERLTPSLLAKAFRGELAGQEEPGDSHL